MDELQEQIQKVDKWKWYIDQKPKWLVQILQKRYGTQVTTHKLRAIRKEMKEKGTWETTPQVV